MHCNNKNQIYLLSLSLVTREFARAHNIFSAVAPRRLELPTQLVLAQLGQLLNELLLRSHRVAGLAEHVKTYFAQLHLGAHLEHRAVHLSEIVALSLGNHDLEEAELLLARHRVRKFLVQAAREVGGNGGVRGGAA